MTRIYAIRGHRYEDVENRRLYFIPERGWIEVPEDVGRLLLADHSPDKLVDITGEPDPEEASARLRAGLPLRPPPVEVRPLVVGPERPVVAGKPAVVHRKPSRRR